MEDIHMTYHTKGTCSSAIDFEIEDGILKSVQFTGGCNGNLKGICALVQGMKVEEVIEKLKGIRCGFKSTSCINVASLVLAYTFDVSVVFRQV